MTVSNERRIPDDPSMASGDRLQMVPDHQETCREKFFNPMSQVRKTQARHRGDRLRFPGVQAPGHQSHKVPERLQPFKEGLSGEPPDSHSVFLEQLAGEPKQKTPDDTRRSSEEESTDLPSVANWSKRSHTSKPTGRHNGFTHFLQDPDGRDCRLTKTTRAPCRYGSDARRDHRVWGYST